MLRQLANQAVAVRRVAMLLNILLPANQLRLEIRRIALRRVGMLLRFLQPAFRLGHGIAALGVVVKGSLGQGANQMIILVITFPDMGMGEDFLFPAHLLITGSGMGMLCHAADVIPLCCRRGHQQIRGTQCRRQTKRRQSAGKAGLSL